MRARVSMAVAFAVLVVAQGCNEQPDTRTLPVAATRISEWQAREARNMGLPVSEEIDLGGGVRLEVVYIPRGTFLMGSPATESARFDDEGPRHPFTVPRGFYMGVYEITREQYAQVMGIDGTHSGAPDLPVGNLSWCEALTFCRELSRRTGIDFRLPTEAEWEYACRAGSSGAHFFGEDEERLAEYAWYRRNSAGTPRPVGRKPSNDWGLHDMHGNVWEWCWSVYRSYPYDALDGRERPSALGDRVLRGGSWHDVASRCRSAGRLTNATAFPDRRFGLRVVISFVKDIELGEGEALRLVYIPPGDFPMGSGTSAGRRVTFSKGFYMGMHEVTQGQYEQVMGENPAQFRDPARPVDSVSWEQAAAFCSTLSARMGADFRLPTEAEWEYACLAGGADREGSEDHSRLLDEAAWHAGNSGGATHRVGRKQGNAWGLFDMQGNVSEWCQTIYRDPSPGAVWGRGRSLATSKRVLKGGSWQDDPARCAPTGRAAASISSVSNTNGFRVVAVFDP